MPPALRVCRWWLRIGARWLEAIRGPLHMAAGVTLGRDPGNDNNTLLLLEKRINSGEIMGPRMRNSGFIEGKSPFSAKLGFVIASVEEAREKVRWYAAHGYWGIKIYNSMTPDL